MSLADEIGPNRFIALAIDVLKYPASAGEATHVLLDKLQATVPGAPDFDGDVWKAVAYAEAKNWPVDLRAPPTRPAKDWLASGGKPGQGVGVGWR